MGRKLTRDELEATLHLRLLPGLGDTRLRELLRKHGSARAVLELAAEELGAETAAARWQPKTLRRLELALEELRRAGDRALAIHRSGYPRKLRELHDPPCLLFARGRLDLLARPAVAVIGTRRHTAYGAEAAERIARELSGAGVVVVSGLARGIDGVAHQAALTGGTIAVLGSALDVPYPRENRPLFHQIGLRGLALSEFPPGTPPLPYHFPQRNRIIAALSLAVVVVEARAESGSFITVEHALDLGRDVFAVPGPIGRETSAGTNQLIRDGATLVTCAADILEELNLEPASAAAGTMEPALRVERGASPPEDAGANADSCAQEDTETDALFRALALAPRHVDDLAAACALPAGRALAQLLALELDGRARQLPGARFVRA